MFLAVARSGTLTAASSQVAVSVSTLHRHLAAFEQKVGVQLFERGPRGYQLTNAGEALLPRAEDVEEAMFAATRAVVGHDQQASGEVRVTLPPPLLEVVAPHLADFLNASARIRLVVQVDDGLLDLNRETDLALRATTQPLDSAIGRNVCGLAWGLYAGANAAGDLPWIHYEGLDGSPGVRWRRAEFGAVQPRMKVRSVAAMRTMLQWVGAQGLLPCFIGDVTPGVRRLRDKPVAMNQLWLLVHADLKRSARVRTVIDFLVPRLLAEKSRLEGG